jgi:hypothetical protein
MHDRVREVGRIAPRSRAGLDPVRARLLGVVRSDGDGMEATPAAGERCRQGQGDVRGVSIDTGEPGEGDGYDGLLGNVADHGLPEGFTDLDAAAGQLPVAVVDPTDHEDLAGGGGRGSARFGSAPADHSHCGTSV